MKLIRTTLLVGGICNLLVAAFHVFLGWQFLHLRDLAPGLLGLLQMFNVGGTAMILFLGITAIWFRREIMTTRLGAAVLWLNIAVYATRALGEILFAVHFSWPVFAVCLLLAALFAVVLKGRWHWRATGEGAAVPI